MIRPAASQAVPTGGPALAVWWPRVVAVAVPTASFGTHALLYGRWIVDDAGITRPTGLLVPSA